ncbi:MAG: hypothetical protein DRH24_14230 [Deltaproteobacteria bacterium]|nr:MAG: hypothetical protein DRH24_14230 [Deltaproteobacteria bacterium]
MRVYRPLLTNCIVQKFGLKGTIPKMLPVYRKFGLKAHNGFDIICWYREPIYHSGDFEGVAKTYVDMGGGIGVDIIGKEFKLRYWHLKEFVVKDGQRVKMGDLIGYGDNTGFSTGNHLHLGLKRVDENGRTINKDNGYFGAIDPEPYFVNEFVLKERVKVLKKLIQQIKSKLIEIRYYGNRMD